MNTRQDQIAMDDALEEQERQAENTWWEGLIYEVEARSTMLCKAIKDKAREKRDDSRSEIVG